MAGQDGGAHCTADPNTLTSSHATARPPWGHPPAPPTHLKLPSMPDTSIALTIMRVRRKGTCAGMETHDQATTERGRRNSHAQTATAAAVHSHFGQPSNHPQSTPKARSPSPGTSRGSCWPQSSRQSRCAAACLRGVSASAGKGGSWHGTQAAQLAHRHPAASSSRPGCLPMHPCPPPHPPE